MRAINLGGQRFGKLVVSALAETGRRRKWRCICDCGNVSIVAADNLRSGNSTACGRCRLPTLGNQSHGHKSMDGGSPTYISWQAMKRRCNDSSREGAKYYFERGIKYDPRWQEFDAFLADMGERPDGKTLDRRDNDQGYSKDNCRWATPLEQTRNRRHVLLAQMGA